MTTYDKTKPLGSELASLLDDRSRDNFAALEERLSKEHQFPDNSDATRQGRHKFGVGNTTARNAAFPVPYAGAFWAYNTDVASAQIHDGSTWRTLTPASTLLVGEIKLIANPTSGIPAGWFLCNGQELSTVTYAALYAACGGASNWYGSPSGGGLFVLPDFRSRRPVGYNPSDVDHDTPGKRNATGKTRTLTTNEMPAHAHPGSSVANEDSGVAATRYDTGDVSDHLASGGNTVRGNWFSFPQHNHLLTIASQGAGAAFDIRDEYLTAGYIIWSGVP